MFQFRPKYSVEVTSEGSNYVFYVWRKTRIVVSGHGFKTATDAANAGIVAKKDLLNAWKIANERL